MSNISGQLIKDSYNYVLQSELISGIVYRIGGSVAENPKFISGLTVNANFTYSDGTEFPGYVLTCDASGNAVWGPVSGATSGVVVTGGTFDYSAGTLTLVLSNGVDVPISGLQDIYVTGGVVSGNSIVFSYNDINTFQVTGITPYNLFSSYTASTQVTINNKLDTSGFTAYTATTQPLILNSVTGGTYSNGTLNLINNSGATIPITGFTTGGSSTTDSYVTGFTLDNETITLSQNRIDQYSAFNISLSGYVTNNIFSSYTASTQSTINNKLDTSGFTSYTATTQPLILNSVTGGTYSGGTLYLVTNSGNTVQITGFSSSSSSTFTGGTVTGPTNFTNGLTANTISATTYQNVNAVTGGTYNGTTGVITLSGTGSVNGNQITGFTTSFPYLPLSGGTVTGNTIFQSGLTANTLTVTGNTLLSGGLTATTISATTYYNVSSNFQYEIHVSQVDGSDTTGNGTLLNPFASITKGLTLVNSQRKTIIVHPGTYTESPSITVQYTTITGPGLIGGNIVINGTVSTNNGCTISGIKMTNLTITASAGTGNVNILNCEVSGTLTKSGNADYTVLRLCDYGAANITGGGLVAIFGGNPNFTTVNNAIANVIIKSSITVAPVLTNGTLSLVDSVVVAAVSNAVTSSASTVITLANCQFLTSTLNNVAPIVLNGFYSILNCVYDRPNSTLVALSATGGSTNSIDYFQYINADKFITQGGTSLQYVMGDGSLSNGFTGGTVTGGTVFNNGLTANTISATTYYNLPISGLTAGQNISISGSNGNFTISVTGITSSSNFTGGTVSGATNFTGGLTANTISATTYYNYPDTYVTGFTLSANTITLSQNRTDSYSSFTISLSAYTGSSVSGAYLPLSGGTLTGDLVANSGITANTISATIYNNLPIPTLQQVTDSGNTTTNNIVFQSVAEAQFGSGGGILLANNSRLREGTIDGGIGASKGIAQICGAGYELKWEGGRLYVMNDGGLTIREVRYTLNNAPLASDDIDKGYLVGSRWVLDNGDLYLCTVNTAGEAVWEKQIGVSTQIAYYNVDGNLTGDTGFTRSDETNNYQTQINTFNSSNINEHQDSVFYFDTVRSRVYNDDTGYSGETNLSSTQYINNIQNSGGTVSCLEVLEKSGNFRFQDIFGLYSGFYYGQNYVGWSVISGVENSFYYLPQSEPVANGVLTDVNGDGNLTWVVPTSSTFTGGTVSGATNFTGGLTANTIFATNYLNLPTDIRTTGATYSNNTFTFTNNTGGTYSVLFNTVTGLTVNGNLTVTGDTNFIKINTSGMSVNGDISVTGISSLKGVTATGLTVNGNVTVTGTTTTGTISATTYQNLPSFTGGTVSGATRFTSGLTANTISATTYQNLPATPFLPLTGGTVNGQLSVNSTIGSTLIVTTSNGGSGAIYGLASNGVNAYGVYGVASPGEFPESITNGIGGYFAADGSQSYGEPTNKYSVQLVDGTEGLNKVLTCVTSDGKANWETPKTNGSNLYLFYNY